MAQINIKTTVTAPEELTIPLVRADHHDTSNIFRISFEVTMAFFFCLLGSALSLEERTIIHYLSLVASAIAAIFFMTVTIVFSRKSRSV